MSFLGCCVPKCTSTVCTPKIWGLVGRGVGKMGVLPSLSWKTIDPYQPHIWFTMSMEGSDDTGNGWSNCTLPFFRGKSHVMSEGAATNRDDFF